MIDLCQDCVWYDETEPMLERGECACRTDIEWTGRSIVACGEFINKKNEPKPVRVAILRQTYLPWPSHVIFHPPATVVFWDDGTKTVVKCMKDEEFNPEVGLAMCFCKKVMGDGYKRWFKDALKKGRRDWTWK